MRNVKHEIDQLTAYEDEDFDLLVHDCFDQTELADD